MCVCVCLCVCVCVCQGVIRRDPGGEADSFCLQFSESCMHLMNSMCSRDLQMLPWGCPLGLLAESSQTWAVPP